MSLRKAAEMALEFVEWFASDDHSVRPQHKAPEVVEALRQALAHPEQEPVGYVTIETISSWAKVPSIKWFKKPTDGPLYTAPPALAQLEQKPVAWVYNGILHEFDPSEFATSEVTSLYTAPQKREWVGLTDDELKALCHEWQIIYGGYVRPFAETIEAKLKEKNT